MNGVSHEQIDHALRFNQFPSKLNRLHMSESNRIDGYFFELFGAVHEPANPRI